MNGKSLDPQDLASVIRMRAEGTPVDPHDWGPHLDFLSSVGPDLKVIYGGSNGHGRQAADSAPWSEPLGVPGDAPPPTWPSGILTGPIASMTEAVAVALQVPQEVPALTGLTTLAAATRGRWTVIVRDGWTEPLAIYAVPALDSANRKSAVTDTVTRPLRAHQAHRHAALGPDHAEQRRLVELLESDAEALKRQAVKDRTDDARAEYLAAAAKVDEAQAELPCLPRWLGADDITPERLAGLLAEHEGASGIVTAEGGLVGILLGRYSNGQANLDIVLKAWSGDHVEVERQNRPPVVIPRPFLALALVVQPDVITEVLGSREARERGLVGRFLFALPRSWLGTRLLDPAPVPEHIEESWARSVTGIAERSEGTPRTLVLGSAAARALHDYRAQLEPRLHPDRGDLADMAAWAGKAPGQAVRIASLLTLGEDPDAGTVTGDGMTAALALIGHLTEHARLAHHAGRDTRQTGARRVLNYLRTLSQHSEPPRNPGSVSYEGVTVSTRAVHQRFREHSWCPDSEAAREALLDLADLGWLRGPHKNTGPKGGRPTELWELNPAINRRETCR